MRKVNLAIISAALALVFGVFSASAAADLTWTQEGNPIQVKKAWGLEGDIEFAADGSGLPWSVKCDLTPGESSMITYNKEHKEGLLAKGEFEFGDSCTLYYDGYVCEDGNVTTNTPWEAEGKLDEQGRPQLTIEDLGIAVQFTEYPCLGGSTFFITETDITVTSEDESYFLTPMSYVAQASGGVDEEESTFPIAGTLNIFGDTYPLGLADL